MDEKGRDVESVLGATSADKLEEVYGILLGEFPDSGLLQERDSRKMKFTKISEATFEEYGKSWVMVRATDAQMDLSDDEDDED